MSPLQQLEGMVRKASLNEGDFFLKDFSYLSGETWSDGRVLVSVESELKDGSPVEMDVTVDPTGMIVGAVITAMNDEEVDDDAPINKKVAKALIGKRASEIDDSLVQAVREAQE